MKLGFLIIFLISLIAYADAPNPNCVEIGFATHCPTVGTTDSCAFNRGACRLNHGGDHGWVQDYGYGGVIAAGTQSATYIFNIPDRFREIREFYSTADARNLVPNSECFTNAWSSHAIPLAGVAVNGGADNATITELTNMHCGGGLWIC